MVGRGGELMAGSWWVHRAGFIPFDIPLVDVLNPGEDDYSDLTME
jgi:hypothetical protein